MSERLDCSLMASTARDSQNCDLKDVFDEYSSSSGYSVEKQQEAAEAPFVWGLGCRDNRTLNFYVLDSLTQWSLRQKLGLDDDGKQDEGQALILSLNEEKIYKMESRLNKRNLEDFIIAFHQDPNSLSTLKMKSSKSSQNSSNIHQVEIEEIHAGNFVERLVSSPAKRNKPGELYIYRVFKQVLFQEFSKTNLKIPKDEKFV